MGLKKRVFALLAVTALVMMALPVAVTAHATATHARTAGAGHTAAPSLVTPNSTIAAGHPGPVDLAQLMSPTGRKLRVLGREHLIKDLAATASPSSAAATGPAAVPPHALLGPAAGVTATFHVRGQVTDQSSVGIAGIQLDIQSSAHTGVDVEVHTDSSGNYDAAGVPAGSYRIDVGDATNTYASGWWSSTVLITADINAASIIKVTTADLVQNLTLPPIPHITGVITNAADGTPLSTTVTVDDYPGGLSAAGSGPTGLDGSYSVAVNPGTYVVAVGIGFYSRHGWSTTDMEPIVVTAAGDVTGIDLAVPPFGSLIVGLNGGCGANAEIDVYDQYSGFFSSTSTAGEATMNVPAGTYFVGYFDPTGACASGWYGPSGFVASATDAAPVAVTLGTPGSAKVTLPLAHDITGSTPGAPGGMLIEAFTGGAFYVAAVTSDSGHFAVPVAAGTYTLLVASPTGTPAGGWYHAGTTTGDATQATPITVASSNVAIKITIPDGGVISGTVNGPGGVHEAGIEVDAAFNGNVVASAATQSNGLYTISVPVGTYTVFEDGSDTLLAGWYRSGGFAEALSSATALKVSESHIDTANITIPAGYFIGGDVTGEGAAGLHDVAVELFKNGQLYAIEFSGYGGVYNILASAGSYLVGFVDPYDVYGAGWYSSGGYVEDGADATTLVVSSADLTGKDVQLPIITVPDAPTGATAAGFDQGAIVQWDASAADGFSPLTGYTATASPGGASCSTKGALVCSLSGLTNGTPYTFTVVATNEKGDSAPSNTAGPVTPTDVPPPPTSVYAVALDGAADVVWNASTASGVTAYTATISPGGFQCATTGALRCKVSGLTNGTPYTFTVDTTNGNGTGPESGPTASVTPESGLTLSPTRLDNATFGDLSGFANDRYGTDAAVVEQAFGGSASTVFIADGQNFPDALGAGAAAAQFGAPLLLVTPTSIPAAINHELNVLAPTTIYIVGGTASVSNALQAALGTYAPTVTRLDNATFGDLSGFANDRYGTDAAVVEQAFGGSASTVFIADGQNFPDALGAGAAAAQFGAPLLLVTPTSIPAAINHELNVLAPTTIYIVGGTASVSNALQAALGTYAPTVTRLDNATFGDLSGFANDRYGTDAAVVEQAFGGSASTVFIADGQNFPDALGAGAAAAQFGAPLLLVTPTSIPAAINHELNVLAPTTIYIVGGTASVSNALQAALAAYMGP